MDLHSSSRLSGPDGRVESRPGRPAKYRRRQGARRDTDGVLLPALSDETSTIFVDLAVPEGMTAEQVESQIFNFTLNALAQ